MKFKFRVLNLLLVALLLSCLFGLVACSYSEYVVVDIQLDKIYDGKSVQPVVKTTTNSPYTVLYGVEGGEFSGEAPVDAGSYQAKITFAKDGNFKAKTVIKDFTIAKRQLSLSGITIANKLYDGTNNATICGDVQLKNVVEGDDVTVDRLVARFVSDEKGEDIQVVFDNVTLSGTDSKNYQLVLPTLVADIYGEEDLLVVNYLTDGGGKINGVSSQLVERDGSTQSVTAVADEGWIFKQWSDGLTDPVRYDTGVTAGFDVYAVFEREIDEAQLDLFIIAGQSNSVCYTGANSAQLDVLNSDDYPERVYEYRPSLNNIQKLQNPIGEGVSSAGSSMGYVTGGTWFSSMAKSYIETTGRSVVILPAGNPGVTTNTYYSGGGNFNMLMDKYISFKNWIDSSDTYTLGRVMLVWHQGESGTGDNNSVSVATKKVFDDISSAIGQVDEQHPLEQVFFTRISINDACSVEDTKARNEEFVKLNNESQYVLVAPNAMKYYWFDQFADVHHYDMNACNDFGAELGNDIASYYLNDRTKPNVVTYEQTQTMNFGKLLLKGVTVVEDSLIAFDDSMDDDVTWLLANSTYQSYARLGEVVLNDSTDFQLTFTLKLGDKFGSTTALPLLGSSDGQCAILVGNDSIQLKWGAGTVTLNHNVSPVIKRATNNNTCKEVVNNTYSVVCKDGVVSLYVNDTLMSTNSISQLDMHLDLFGRNGNTYLNGIVSNFELKYL